MDSQPQLGLYKTVIPDDPAIQDFFRAMRDDIELQQLGVSGFTDLELYKFYIAGFRDSTAGARDLIQKCLAWRKANDFDAHMASGAAAFDDVRRRGLVVLHPQPARRGISMLVWRQRFHTPTADGAEVMRITMYFMQLVWRAWRAGTASDRVIVMLDLTGVTTANRDFALTRSIIGAMRINFPETLEHLIITPTSWLTGMIATVVRPFLDPVTVQKVVMLGPSELPARLTEYIPLELIPCTLGGSWTAEPVPLAAGQEPPHALSEKPSPSRLPGSAEALA